MDRLKWVLVGIAALLPALLLAAHPLLTLFEQNETELPLAVIWQPLGVTFAAAAVLYGVLMLITRSWAKAGALTALAVVWFFYWDDISGLTSPLVALDRAVRRRGGRHRACAAAASAP